MQSSDNKKLKLGVLAVAEISKKIEDAARVSDLVEIVAVSSRELSKAEEFAKEHNIKKAYGSYDELLDDPEVECVYIPLPTGLRQEWVIKAANKKKHVLSEKPHPTNTSDKPLLEMLEVCKRNNVQFMDGTMWIHTNRTAEIYKNLGKLGRIDRAYAAFTQMADSEEWLQGGNIRTNKEMEPLGCFGDLGWYPIGAIMFSFQYEKPVSVQMINVVFNKLDTIISSAGVIHFSGNRYAVFDAGFTTAHRSEWEINGTKGTMRVDDHVGGQKRSGKNHAYTENFLGFDRFFLDDQEGKEHVVETEPCIHTQKMLERMAKIVRSGKLEEFWPKWVLCNHRVMVALYKSAVNGNQVVDMSDVEWDRAEFQP